MPRVLVGGSAGQVVPVDRDAAGVGHLKAGQHVDQRRLAGAVGADHPDHLAALQVDVDAVERLDTLEADADPTRRETR